MIGDEVVMDRERSPTSASVADLYDAHADTIARYLQRRLEPERVEDAVASVFERALRSYARYVPTHDTPLPWLFGIAANVVADNRRSETRRLRALARLGAGAVEHTAAVLDTSAVDPRLVAELLRLKPADRETLLLVAWGELSYEETASALEVPVGTVRSRLARARSQLTASLPAPPARRRANTTQTEAC